MPHDPALDLLFKSHPWHGVAIGPDKIVAVMAKDAAYGGVFDIGRLPGLLVDRLTHYFLTCKQAPADAEPSCEPLRVYGRDEAHEVIRRSRLDYQERFAQERFAARPGARPERGRA